MSGRPDLFGEVLAQWRWSLRHAALAAVAAGVAWWLAATVTGDARPVAAAVTAVVALAPGISNPRIQLVGFLVGFATGIAIGYVARPWVDAEPMLMIVPIAFFAIVAASTFGRNPISLIQSAASAILAVGSGTADAGWVQFLDALAAAGVAIAFSQVFFAPDVVALLESAGRDVVDQADRVLRMESAGRAAAWGDVARAAGGFEQAASTARGVRRWTVRGRLDARRISAAEERWLLPVRRLSAATALATSTDNGVVDDELGRAAAAVRALETHGKRTAGREPTSAVPGDDTAD